MSAKRIELTGKKFGRLTVFGVTGTKGKNGQLRWNCQCECGKAIVVSGGNLKKSKSCGCLTIERLTTHGLTSHGEIHPLYRCWQNMRFRCENPKKPAFKHYGGRGIKVCDRWQKFKNFIADMGATFKPGLTLERKDVNGNYCPENCTWATWTVQANNKRTNHNLTFNGVTLSVNQWAKRLGKQHGVILQRLDRGWPLEKVLSHHRYHRSGAVL